jgi:hypothetical protein
MRQGAQRAGRAGVEIAVDLHSVDGPLPGVTRNISPDGAFVATPAVMAVGFDPPLGVVLAIADLVELHRLRAAPID